jgi:hypothetical protein
MKRHGPGYVILLTQLMSPLRRYLRLLLLTALAGVTGALAPAAVADAHLGRLSQRIVVDGLSPPTAGVQVRSVEGAIGKVALTTSGSTTAVVLGTSGQPILRSGPAGVQANASSPEWYTDNEPLGIATVPPAATPRAATRWVPVSAQRTWEWFDHRLHPGGAQVVRWSIPLRVDGARVVVRGRDTKAAGVFGLQTRAAGLPAGTHLSVVERPVPALRLANDATTPISVLDADGGLFARIGPKGVEVNVRSPAWLATAQFRNRDLLGSVIDRRAAPKLVLLSTTPELVWPDARLVPRVLPQAAAGPRPVGSPVRIASWSIPVVVGDAPGRRRTIVGTTVVQPQPADTGSAPVSPIAARGLESTGDPDDGGGGLGIVLIIVAGSALLCGGALIVRSRR